MKKETEKTLLVLLVLVIMIWFLSFAKPLTGTFLGSVLFYDSDDRTIQFSSEVHEINRTLVLENLSISKIELDLWGSPSITNAELLVNDELVFTQPDGTWNYHYVIDITEEVLAEQDDNKVVLSFRSDSLGQIIVSDFKLEYE